VIVSGHLVSLGLLAVPGLKAGSETILVEMLMVAKDCLQGAQ
jgi:hypothetical protein